MSMKLGRWLPTIVGILVSVSSTTIEVNQPGQAADDRLAQANPACPAPLLSRLKRHTVAQGETLDSIAQRYNLIPTTIMGLNPAVRSGQAPVGTELLIPPFNGIRVELQPNQTLREVAKSYGVSADVLFEANGCQLKPKVAFVPGVTWSPIGDQSAQGVMNRTVPTLKGYPLPRKPTKYSILLPYGWSLQGATGKTSFHSGIDLEAPLGTAVLSVGDGTIAFAGQQSTYGNVVVINHAEGLQTRYAQLGSLRVSAGEAVKQGQTIGTVGNSGRPNSPVPHLHFEVRSRSGEGWVAENPQPYLLPELSRPDPVKY